MQHLYIYYALPEADIADVVPRVCSMMRVVEDATGQAGRLMQRIDRREGKATLMEVYEDLPDAATFERLLHAAAADAQLPPQLLAQRHIERFEELPCA